MGCAHSQSKGKELRRIPLRAMASVDPQLIPMELDQLRCRAELWHTVVIGGDGGGRSGCGVKLADKACDQTGRVSGGPTTVFVAASIAWAAEARKSLGGPCVTLDKPVSSLALLRSWLAAHTVQPLNAMGAIGLLGCNGDCNRRARTASNLEQRALELHCRGGGRTNGALRLNLGRINMVNKAGHLQNPECPC